MFQDDANLSRSIDLERNFVIVNRGVVVDTPLIISNPMNERSDGCSASSNHVPDEKDQGQNQCEVNKRSRDMECYESQEPQD